jgi:hypothetical protein
VPAIREAMNRLIDRNYIAQVIFGGLANGLPEAHYTHVTGEMTAQEAWNLHVTPAAVQSLPDELWHSVDVDGTSVPRLRAEHFEDLGLLIHYAIAET